MKGWLLIAIPAVFVLANAIVRFVAAPG